MKRFGSIVLGTILLLQCGCEHDSNDDKKKQQNDVPEIENTRDNRTADTASEDQEITSIGFYDGLVIPLTEKGNTTHTITTTTGWAGNPYYSVHTQYIVEHEYTDGSTHTLDRTTFEEQFTTLGVTTTNISINATENTLLSNGSEMSSSLVELYVDGIQTLRDFNAFRSCSGGNQKSISEVVFNGIKAYLGIP